MRVFGVPTELNIGAVRPGYPRKVFYYDCLEDVKRDSESPSEFDHRVQKQLDDLNKVRSQEGFHVRLGSISGSNKKIRQKQVDILLTVDMMNHAFRGNMARASLIAGDLDFKPLVTSLIEHGTYVRVLYDKASAADELRWSADGSEKIRIDEYLDWTVRDDKFEVPSISSHSLPDLLPTCYGIVSSELGEESPIRLLRGYGRFYISALQFAAIPNFLASHPDQGVLERYLECRFECSFQWNHNA